MSYSPKIAAFEYMLDELVIWCNELGKDPKEELNLLKVIKLNFFIAAASASENNSGLLETFNNFYAMPYGHVESSVYDAVKGFGSLEKYQISNKGIEFDKNKSKYLTLVSDQDKQSINKSIQKIKQEDVNFILKSAMYLVNLSHEWRSWRVMYKMAKLQNRHSLKIPLNLIQTDTKIFVLKNAF